MAEFLLEIFCEEIPASQQEKARQEFAIHCGTHLTNAGFKAKPFSCETTPRRIALYTPELAFDTKNATVEKKGPPVTAPANIIEAFAKSNNATIEDLLIKEVAKGKYYFYESTSSRPVEELLAEALPKMLDEFVWSKSMRWENTSKRWIRPIRNIAALYNGQAIKFEYAGLMSNNHSFGHRVLSNKRFSFTNWQEYQDKLVAHNVILSHELRKKIITNEIGTNFAGSNHYPEIDLDLLAEVADLTEKPFIMVGNIPAELMKLPKEVLTVTIKHHQRYFTVAEKNGNLAPKFIFVANHNLNPANIIKGNEKVLKARLSDAIFYWQNDCNKTLEELETKLSNIQFYYQLGSISDKLTRLYHLGQMVAPELELDPKLVAKAIKFAKLDLGTETVFEFTELQGIIASYLAENFKAESVVITAIREHYMEDAPPQTPLGSVLAIIDKLDSLVGFFAIGKKPSGSKDQFGLRRLALDIIKICHHQNFDIDLGALITASIKHYQQQFSGLNIKADFSEEIREFVLDRLKFWLQGSEKIRFDITQAALSCERLNIYKMISNCKKLANLTEEKNFTALVLLYKRIHNILAKENITDINISSLDKLENRYEQKLLTTIRENKFFELKDFSELSEPVIKEELFKFHQPIAEFFENVMVNDSNPTIKQRRLSLLLAVKNIFDRLGDFKVIEVK